MSTFLIIFLFVYGSMNGYALFRLRSAFELGNTGTLIWGIFFFFLFISPIMVRFVERAGYHSIAVPLAWIAFTWLGILFLFICFSLTVEAFRVLAIIADKTAAQGFYKAAFFHKLSFYLPLALACMIAVFGYFETNNIRTEKIIIGTAKLPSSVKSLRVVQISDLHIGPLMNDRLRKIIDVVKEARPDILVSTGDLVDGQAYHLDGSSGMFREVETKYGKYAVTGNHEFYAGLDDMIDFTRKGGFAMLRDAGASVSGIINIAGVDDLTVLSFGGKKRQEESEILASLPSDRFTILLKHRPDVDEKSLGLFDLQLSGHTHKGQIFPFVFIVERFFPYIAGLYDLPKGSRIYTSRGTGTWGPPIRFLSSPEVTVIDIVSQP